MWCGMVDLDGFNLGIWIVRMQMIGCRPLEVTMK